MVDGDPGAGGLPGEKAGGGTQQVAGVHQDDAAVHAFHPLPWGSSVLCGGSPSLPDPKGVEGRNSIIGVADLTVDGARGIGYAQ
ncbi:hypothetical protein Snoj_53290 [Streptomyces nojiriensis]|uniref:Uncharacterized protein n=1 Tax=Streptomyces nojiriensis TaxID=66374 RepID=A0ABQ3STD8_9ACTN|nr:hypothetical protein GCM10010205_21530 [Streptomyces nojiriensis]GHI71411.1 hypothetical protein Snoj_53290 [Streptomyces nojiriensis]